MTAEGLDALCEQDDLQRRRDGVRESRYNVWVEREGTRYVYNGASGALLRLATPDYEALRSFLAGDPDTGCRPALLAEMAKGRMLVSDDHDELAALETLYRLT